MTDDKPAAPAPEPVAWMHTLDNTEGLETNEPEVIFTSSERNPFGKAGRDYSRSYKVTSVALYTHPAPVAAPAPGSTRR